MSVLSGLTISRHESGAPSYVEEYRMQDYHLLEPTSPTENVLRSLGRKLGSGAELTLSEQLMAMTATAKTTANYYGPGPTDMTVQKPELPETVKGVLANYIG